MGVPPGSRLRQPKPTEGTLNCQQPSRELHLARLQRPQAAQQVHESALASLDPEVIKTRPRLMAALATALSGRATSTMPVVSGARPWTWPPASRWHRTSRTYAGPVWG